MKQNFWKNKNVLVTGHTGFKGSWLTLWLLQMGSKVQGISLEPGRENDLYNNLDINSHINSFICDIRDKEKLGSLVKKIKPEVIFHLAAQPLVRDSYINPVDTWRTNVMGTINLIDTIRKLDQPCSTVAITTDKVYRNKEWVYGYRENDELGGKDPYSSSKAACELAISSWRNSFANESKWQHFNVVTARAGNVIGGGDWATDRIVPDCIRALIKNEKIKIRNPRATRPWQHVLEPLSGYLLLAEEMSNRKDLSREFNFGPNLEANRCVDDLVQEIIKNWPGEKDYNVNPEDPHEASLLDLTIERAKYELGWSPIWDFEMAVSKTVQWYKTCSTNPKSAMESCLNDIECYSTTNV